MNGFEKRAHQIKEKIMKTTLDMLRISGPKGLRIADISKMAQVSQVTIYNYFGSKEALLREVFIAYTDKAVRDFENYMNEGHSLKNKIEFILYQGRESYKDFPLHLIKQLLHEDQELTLYIEKQYKGQTLPLIIRMIEEGKQSGEIPEQVTIESVLAFIQLYMNQYEMILDMALQSGDRDKFYEDMIHMFFYGICGKA